MDVAIGLMNMTGVSLLSRGEFPYAFLNADMVSAINQEKNHE